MWQIHFRKDQNLDDFAIESVNNTPLPVKYNEKLVITPIIRLISRNNYFTFFNEEQDEIYTSLFKKFEKENDYELRFVSILSPDDLKGLLVQNLMLRNLNFQILLRNFDENNQNNHE